MRHLVTCFSCDPMHLNEKPCRRAAAACATLDAVINPDEGSERDDAKQRRPFCFYASYGPRQLAEDELREAQLELFPT